MSHTSTFLTIWEQRIDLNLGELPECPSSLSPQRQTPPIIDTSNKQSLSHEAAGEKYLATR